MSVPAYMLITVEEYLETEPFSPCRREYVDGQVYDMVGSTDAHNIICGNLHAIMHSKLKGTGCRVYICDMKARVEATNCFYYPDLLVTCEPYASESVFKKSPVILVEVLSKSTRDKDMREKRIAYKTIPTLKEYMVVDQKQPLVQVHRKNGVEAWESELVQSPNQLVLSSFPGEPLTLRLEDIYADTDLI